MCLLQNSHTYGGVGKSVCYESNPGAASLRFQSLSDFPGSYFALNKMHRKQARRALLLICCLPKLAQLLQELVQQ